MIILAFIAASGILIALAIAAYFAYSVRKYGVYASDRLLPEKGLDSFASSSSLFASWMNLGNVIIGALILVIAYKSIAIWAVITWIIGFLILMRHARRTHEETQSHATILELIENKFKSRLLSRTCSLLTMLTATGTVALEMLVGIVLLNTLGIDLTSSVILLTVTATIAVCVGLFTEHGGMRAVFASDRVQSITIGLSLLALVALVFLGMADTGQMTIGQQMASSVSDASPLSSTINLVLFIVGFFTFQAFILLGDLTTWQRIQFASTSQVAKTACKKAIYLNGLGWLVLFVAGMLLSYWPASNIRLPEVSMPTMEFAYSQGEPLASVLQLAIGGVGGGTAIGTAVLAALVLLGMYSAILSTTDSYLVTAAEAFMFQWTQKGRRLRRVQDLQHDELDRDLGRLFRWVVWFFVAIAVLLVLLSIYAKIPLVSLIFFVWAMQLPLAPLAISALHAPGAASHVRHWALAGVVLAVVSIITLVVLSTGASSLLNAYSYSYAAPVVAVCVPFITLTIAAMASRKARRLKWLGPMMFGFAQKKDKSSLTDHE